MDPFFQIVFDDGKTFDYSGDRQRTLDEIRRFNPADVDGYLRYLKASEKRYRVGFEKLGFKSFDSLWQLIKFLPNLIGMRSDRSVYNLALPSHQRPLFTSSHEFSPVAHRRQSVLGDKRVFTDLLP